MQEILARPQDTLEEKACALAGYMGSLAGLPTEVMGVTGSLLTYSHNPAFSDIDLLIYGGEYAARLKERLGIEGTAEFRHASAEEVAGWCARVVRNHGLSMDEAAHLARRQGSARSSPTRVCTTTWPTRVT